MKAKTAEATTRIELVSTLQPKLLKYTIVNTYPHDTFNYTQGLEFYKDTLYERTRYKTGISLSKIRLQNGKSL